MDSIVRIGNSNPLIEFSNSNLEREEHSSCDSNDHTYHDDGNQIRQLTIEEQISVEKFHDYQSGHEYVLLLASTYIDEAAKGRNGYFIGEPKQLRLYRLYNHKIVRFGLFFLILVNLALIFFEEPSVAGLSLPYWVTMLIELLCMFGYFLRLIHGWQLIETEENKMKELESLSIIVPNSESEIESVNPTVTSTVSINDANQTEQIDIIKRENSESVTMDTSAIIVTLPQKEQEFVIAQPDSSIESRKWEVEILANTSEKITTGQIEPGSPTAEDSYL